METQMDEDVVMHRHEGDDVRLELDREEAIDGLQVRHFRCQCGEERVLLAPRNGEEPGRNWPSSWVARG